VLVPALLARRSSSPQSYRNADHGYESAFNALVDSLKKFGLDYFDLYLLHSPAECEQKRLDSWRALETAQKLGIVKSIGVSNFGA
jgi:2,5-diketo-D-gluconate reductase A